MFPVSTTVRPVTHTAEVDVKSAFTNPRCLPAEAVGSIKRLVPMEMSNVNPRMILRAGERKSDSEIRKDLFLALILFKKILDI